ncbi:MAG: carbon storage regulator [Candidatus Melainabacteria bacterium GWF2_37_15]|nr:MAG: carbon storage regulator [Candidatus Melainabacteria bacterium GWF2_37_15]
MLVLTRKKGQKLIINDNIEITVLETRGDSVKIGINAPREVSVFREEIYEEIKKANEQAQREVIIADLDQVLAMQNVKKDVSNDYMKKIQSFTNKLKSNDKE